MKQEISTSVKPRVLVTYVEAGMGHIVSAAAISDSLKAKYGNQVEVIDSYTFRDSGNEVLTKYEKYLVQNVKDYSNKYPYGYIQYASMYLLGQPQVSLKFVHGLVFAKQVNATIEEYKKFNPDVIVCTHYFLHYCAVRYRDTVNKKIKVVAYCPDNNVHGWWDNRGDMLYTNNPMATKQAYEANFKSGRVSEKFYPTRKAVVDANESKEFYRKQFGIPLDKFAVVVADGVYAKAKAKNVCKALIKSDLPLTVCLLAGKNDKIIAYFENLKDKLKPNITLLTFGFLPNAYELYAACDLFITKAGPNAILDSVMMGTPIIADFCATPIEEKTKNLFVKRFTCGYYIPEPYRIKKKVEQLIRNPEQLSKFADSLKFFDKTKNGADEIADDIITMIFALDEHQREHFDEENAVIDKYMALKFVKESKSARLKMLKYCESPIKCIKLQRRISKIQSRIDQKSQKIKSHLRCEHGSRKYAKILEYLDKKHDDIIDQ